MGSPCPGGCRGQSPLGCWVPHPVAGCGQHWKPDPGTCSSVFVGPTPAWWPSALVPPSPGSGAENSCLPIIPSTGRSALGRAMKGPEGAGPRKSAAQSTCPEVAKKEAGRRPRRSFTQRAVFWGVPTQSTPLLHSPRKPFRELQSLWPAASCPGAPHGIWVPLGKGLRGAGVKSALGVCREGGGELSPQRCN